MHRHDQYQLLRKYITLVQLNKTKHTEQVSRSSFHVSFSGAGHI